jgi:hypothetical protein
MAIKAQTVLSERAMVELHRKELTVLNRPANRVERLHKVVAATKLSLRKTEQTVKGRMQHQATTARPARMTVHNALMLHQANELMLHQANALMQQHRAMTAQPAPPTVRNASQMRHNGQTQHRTMTAQPALTTVHNANRTHHNGRMSDHNALNRNKRMTVRNAAKRHNGRTIVLKGVKLRSAKHQVIHLPQGVNHQGVSLHAANRQEAHLHRAITAAVEVAEAVAEMTDNIVE